MVVIQNLRIRTLRFAAVLRPHEGLASCAH